MYDPPGAVFRILTGTLETGADLART